MPRATLTMSCPPGMRFTGSSLLVHGGLIGTHPPKELKAAKDARRIKVGRRDTAWRRTQFLGELAQGAAKGVLVRRPGALAVPGVGVGEQRVIELRGLIPVCAGAFRFAAG